MAWDSESERVILVGGFLGSEPTNETWAYDPNAKKWIQMKPADMFEGLSNMSVAYDKESDRVIIFGGLEPWPPPYWVKNTWAYDYNTDTWTRLSKYGPSRRQDQRMVYDTESDRVILFGGAESTVSALSSREKFGDTWAYDFNTDTWQNMKPNPSPPERACFQMGYDIESDRVILWGGYGYKENDNRVWAYDYNTNTWKELRPFTDAPAQWGDMDYDIESDRMVLYGGSINGSTDTWTYDYNTDTWTAMAPNQAPGKLSHHRMAYITPLDQIILFGGMADQDRENPLDETWIYDLNSDTWETVILRQE
jgi:N-acetylneuraminic acid mutarotase